MKTIPDRVWHRSGWRLLLTGGETTTSAWHKMRGLTQVTINLAYVSDIDGVASELWTARVFKNGQCQDMIRDDDIARLKATCDALFALELI